MLEKCSLRYLPAIIGACLLALSASAVWAQPFACTGEAFIVQDLNAQLTQVDQSVTPFVFVNIGGTAGIEYNNMGFRRQDGLLYAVDLAPGGANRIIQVDSTGAVTGLNANALPVGLPTTIRFVAGDVSIDGTTLYLHNYPGVTTLYTVALPGAGSSGSIAIAAGGTGNVADWAVHPTTGVLYGGDDTDGQLAVLDPVAGTRTDSNVAGTCGTPADCLPAGTAFGGAWFNAAGQLFLYENNGPIYEIDITGPTIDATPTGPGSTRNDGAACVQNIVGAAKLMTTTMTGLPATVTIVHTFQNLSSTSPTDDLTAMSALDDLEAVFGAGNFSVTGVASSSGTFHNAGFTGTAAGSFELINQAPTQGLTATFPGAGSSATVTVTLTLTSLDGADPMGNFCNAVLATGTVNGIIFGDLSTSGLLPDPDADGSPDERNPSCFAAATVPVELMKYSID